MTGRRPGWRRVALLSSRTAAVAAAVALAVSVWGMSRSGVPGAAAATDAGGARIITPLDASRPVGAALAGGTSATPFSIALPVGAACTSDSANAGYRVQSYMVPARVNPNTLTFGSVGPLPTGTGTSFRQPLFGITSDPFVNQQTANADKPGGPGYVINIAAFNFSVFKPGDVAPGTYNVGIACTKGPASPAQLHSLWNVQIAIAADASDKPAGIGWKSTSTEPAPAAVSPAATGGRAAAAAPTPRAAASTGTDGSATPAAAPAPTSTGAVAPVAVAATTSTASAPEPGPKRAGGPPTPTPLLLESSRLVSLPAGSATSVVVWFLLVLIFGRMAILLGRRPKVVTAGLA